MTALKWWQTAVKAELRSVQARLDRQQAAREFELLLHYQRHQPGVHELMQELRALVNEYSGNRVLVGEADDIAYYGAGDDELHLVFNFPRRASMGVSRSQRRAVSGQSTAWLFSC